MTLVVAAPAGREPERRHVLDVVLSDRLGLAWRLEPQARDDVRITLDGDPDGRAVTLPDVLLATADPDWLTEASLPPMPLPRLPVGPTEGTPFGPDELLPVVYGRAGARRLAEESPDGVALNVDVFGGVFALLTRYEEVVDGPRDAYDRFPAARSLAARAGFLRLPLADAYVEVLRAALARTWPRLHCRQGSYAVLLTHDVDEPLSTVGLGPAGLARVFAGDVVVRRDAGLLLRRARAVAAARRGRHDGDPHDTFDLLMDVSERHGLRSAFYFLAHAETEAPRPRYDLVDHPWVRRLIGHVHRRGHEVGLHAAFGTYRDPERTAEELRHLRAVAEREGVVQERWGGRQHYLQWTNPVTWRNWAEAGLDYDCTLAFAEVVGFRTGTCHPYRTFDLLERRPLPLVERPFQVMDVTLFDRLRLTPAEAAETTLDVAAQCRRFRGTLGVLCHNDSLRTASRKRWYESLVRAVTT